MKKGPISDKQREILEYMKQVVLSKGYPPSVRERLLILNPLLRSSLILKDLK